MSVRSRFRRWARISARGPGHVVATGRLQVLYGTFRWTFGVIRRGDPALLDERTRLVLLLPGKHAVALMERGWRTT